MAEQHGAHQTAEAWVISLTEDFCKSPTAPVGYMIAQKLSESIQPASSVHGCGTPLLNLGSRISTVIGNEAGVGGGVVSGVNVGMCKPVAEFATKVRAEGLNVLRHDTVLEMNCTGPEGTGNTRGQITYLSGPGTSAAGAADVTDVPHDDKPTLRPKGDPRGYVYGPNETPIPVYNGDIPHNGVYSVDAEGPFIVLDPNRNPNAQRYTLAHEREHVFQDYRNRVPGQPAFDGDIGDPIEGELGARKKAIEAIEKDPTISETERKVRKEHQEEQIENMMGASKAYGGLWLHYCGKLRAWMHETGQTSKHAKMCEGTPDGMESF